MNSTPEQLCRTIVVERPKAYFRSDGDMPERIELTFHKPPGFEHLTVDEFRALVTHRVEAVEAEAAEKRRRTDQRILGRRAIRKQHHEESPASYAEHFKLNPQVASRDKWRRIEALQRLKEFVLEYREALRRWRGGERDVVFPYGTDLMRVMHGVRCCPGPA